MDASRSVRRIFQRSRQEVMAAWTRDRRMEMKSSEHTFEILEAKPIGRADGLRFGK